ncbi:hypothetical protein CEXT_156611, partial [Caerostris extrusa]
GKTSCLDRRGNRNFAATFRKASGAPKAWWLVLQTKPSITAKSDWSQPIYALDAYPSKLILSGIDRIALRR